MPITANLRGTDTERSVGAFHAAVLRDDSRDIVDPLAEKIERRWVALRELLRKETA